jgi:Tfp pilus tip-associated adhesin PilY1
LLETDIVEAYSLDADGNRVDMDGDGDVDSDDTYTYRTVSCISPDTNGDCNPSTTHSALSDEKPWAIKLYTSSAGNPSERIITQPLITAGIVFIVTFIPDGDPCEGNGDAWILAVDWETGQIVDEPVFDINGDGTIDDADKTVEDSSGTEHEVVGFYLGGGRPSSTMAIYGSNIAVGGASGLLGGQAPLSSTPLIQVNLPDQDTKLKSWQQDLK